MFFKNFSFLLILVFLLSSCFNSNLKTSIIDAPREENNSLVESDLLEDTSLKNNIFLNDSRLSSNPVAFVEDSFWRVFVRTSDWNTNRIYNWDYIYIWDRIMTMSDSNISIVFEDDSVIRLDEKSSFSINKETKWELQTSLNKWTLWWRIIKPVWAWNDTTIDTWWISLAVRWTSFLLFYDDIKQKVDLTVFDSFWENEENKWIMVYDKKTTKTIKVNPEEKINKDSSADLIKSKIDISSVYKNNDFVKENTKKDIVYMSKLIDYGVKEESKLKKLSWELENTLPKDNEIVALFDNKEVSDSLLSMQSKDKSNVVWTIAKDKVVTNMKKDNSLDSKDLDLAINNLVKIDVSWLDVNGVFLSVENKMPDEMKQKEDVLWEYKVDISKKIDDMKEKIDVESDKKSNLNKSSSSQINKTPNNTQDKKEEKKSDTKEIKSENNDEKITNRVNNSTDINSSKNSTNKEEELENKEIIEIKKSQQIIKDTKNDSKKTEEVKKQEKFEKEKIEIKDTESNTKKIDQTKNVEKVLKDENIETKKLDSTNKSFELKDKEIDKQETKDEPKDTKSNQEKESSTQENELIEEALIELNSAKNTLSDKKDQTKDKEETKKPKEEKTLEKSLEDTKIKDDKNNETKKAEKTNEEKKEETKKDDWKSSSLEKSDKKETKKEKGVEEKKESIVPKVEKKQEEENEKEKKKEIKNNDDVIKDAFKDINLNESITNEKDEEDSKKKDRDNEMNSLNEMSK